MGTCPNCGKEMQERQGQYEDGSQGRTVGRYCDNSECRSPLDKLRDDNASLRRELEEMREQLRLANVDQANTETEFDELREENASLRRELAEKREEHLKSDLYWRESYIEAETERLQLESRLAIAIEGVKKALAEYYRSDLDVIEVERILTDTLSRLRVRLIAAAALEGEGD